MVGCQRESCVVLGSSDMLGEEILAACQAHGLRPAGVASATGAGNARVDPVALIREHRPAYVFCTGRHRTGDACAMLPSVARASRDVDAVLVHFCTRCEFDTNGRLLEATDDGEARSREALSIIEASGAPFLFVRCGQVFALHGECPMTGLLSQVLVDRRIDVDAQRRFQPVLCSDLVEMTFQLLRQGRRGVVHAANMGDCTAFEFMDSVRSLLGDDWMLTPQVDAQPANHAASGASYLDLTETIREIGHPRHWRDAIADYARTLEKDP